MYASVCAQKRGVRGSQVQQLTRAIKINAVAGLFMEAAIQQQMMQIKPALDSRHDLDGELVLDERVVCCALQVVWEHAAP